MKRGGQGGEAESSAFLALRLLGSGLANTQVARGLEELVLRIVILGIIINIVHYS